jgi:23S rRNA (cytidine1920-2'-O)/16S rRNA (cytidine1409-2'-O)-methyltransferase
LTRVERVRADELVVRQGLAPSRSRAKVLIVAGDVQTPDGRVTKPAEQLAADTVLSLREKPRYVSRGGLKLEAALASFSIGVGGMVAADIGASTGGFTDCLLQHGAARVYAVDVGYGQLNYTLREDARVVVLERTNARYMEALPEMVDLIVIDVSFISLRLVIPAIQESLSAGGRAVALIKPQFEAGRGAVSRQGVVRDENVRERVVRQIIDFAAERNLGFEGLIRSPLVGPAGNEEFLLSVVEGFQPDEASVEHAIRSVFAI